MMDGIIWGLLQGKLKTQKKYSTGTDPGTCDLHIVICPYNAGLFVYVTY